MLWDQSQIRYMEEVLGISFLAGLPPAETTPVALLILTPRLEVEESALLTKILTSVRLPTHDHLEVDNFSEHRAANLVLFDGGSGAQVDEEGRKSWHLPRLRDMLGNSPDITALKRTTWTLLQQLSQELG